MASVYRMCTNLFGVFRTPLSYIHQSLNYIVGRISTAPPIFALTIGIDEYENSTIKDLCGCTADADDIVKFLVKTLRVPPTHITSLRNKQATAERITAAFEALATDPRITKDDNSIFVFYAGHGSEAQPPDDWPTSGNIQALLPHNFDPGSDDNPIARNGLADIKLSRLLENIANEKGNNITVILDSCHAGSGTRDFGNVSAPEDRRPRGVRLHELTRLGPEAFHISPKSIAVDKGTGRHQGLSSHVLLAACNPLQQAYEKDGRGVFTVALLKLLRTADLRKISYSDIIRRLHMIPDQNPQCEGIHQRRIFLRDQIAAHHRVSFDVTQSKKGVYTIDAGEEAGITVDTEFAVFDTAFARKLGRLVVDVVTEFECILRSVEGRQPFDIPDAGAIAVLTRLGKSMRDVRFLLEFRGKFSDNFTIIGNKVLEKLGFDPSFLKVLSKGEENPDLIMAAEGKNARFKITDRICLDVGLTFLPHSPPRDRDVMQRILCGATNFFWNLHRTSSGRHSISRRIQCECYELGHSDALEIKPIGDNLIKDNMLHIEIGAIPKKYGFRIINDFDTVQLFVSVFYFRMSDFRIESWYEPPSAARNGQFPPLQPKGFLTIGYGSGGAASRTFDLYEGQDVDVGYLKLFLSTQYVDYSQIQQDSPFLQVQDRGTVVYKPKHRVWDTMLVPIVLRRN